MQLIFNIFCSIVLNLRCNKYKLYKRLDYCYRDMLNFDFLGKGFGKSVSTIFSYFVYNFSRKMCLIFYFINWPNFIAWLLILCEMLVNMCIAIICQPGCDAINSEINFIFQINPFFYMIKKSRQKSKYLKDEKSF